MLLQTPSRLAWSIWHLAEGEGKTKGEWVKRTGWGGGGLVRGKEIGRATSLAPPRSDKILAPPMIIQISFVV
jgi:hypothetical protein